jgi:hypothetical protein
MAFLLDGKPLAVDVAFTTSDGTQYPANWLRLTTKAEKEAIGITEVADAPTYDSRFYWGNGTAKALDDKTETVNGKEIKTLGVKSILKAQEKDIAGSLLAKYDWYVIRKAEKSTAIPTAITTYRNGVRTACDTREKEIDACADTAALVTLYSSTEKDGVFTPNMTQYPEDPNE